MRRYDSKTDTVEMSVAVFKEKDLKPLGKVCFNILRQFGLLHIRTYEIENEKIIECNNLTLINLVLKFFGPMRENNLVKVLLVIQVRKNCT